MKCEDTRAILAPEPGPLPASPEATEAFEHYGQCEECQRFFRLQRVISERVRRAAAGQQASQELRQRLRAALEVEAVPTAPPPEAKRRFAWKLVAGIGSLVAAAAVLVLAVTLPGSMGHVAQPLVQQALVGLSTEGTMSSSDTEELEDWLESKVGYRVEIPVISDAVLVGGRVADLGGIRTAVVTYVLRGRPLTYFAMPSAEVLGSRITHEDVETVSSNGYHVATWMERGAARAVVAPLPRNELAAVAEECKRMASATSAS